MNGRDQIALPLARGAVALVLVFFVVLFFAITIVKMKH